MIRALPTSWMFLAVNALAPSAGADGESDFWKALAEGEATLKFRYRAEFVEDDAPATPKDALGSTLRTSLSYRTGDYEGFRAFVEFEDVGTLGNELFNSTQNGVTDRPVVADPSSTEINQLYLEYGAGEDLAVSVGRKEVVFDNARFIGNVAWRQNHQSYDLAHVAYTGIDDVVVHYAYVDNVNNIFGSRLETTTHLLNVSAGLGESTDLTLYGYHLDLDAAPGLSPATYGARVTGEVELGDETAFVYTAEYADQSDAGDNPGVDADYLLAEVGADFSGVRATVSSETLSGSAADGQFTTPLATAHKFNGFADKFLTTPTDGLEDLYLTVRGNIGDAKCLARYHDFSSDTGDTDYGTELDFNVLLPINEHVTFGLRAAFFDADDAAFTDATKVMAWFDLAP